MAKRYYWLKLKADWFSDKRIKKLRSIAGGDTYTIIYLKMMLLSLKDEGKLYFEGVEDNFASEIALALDEDAENVKLTLAFLQRHGLIEIGDDDEYQLTEVPTIIGSETASAMRVREHRERKKENRLLQCNTTETGCNNLKQICSVEREKEIEIERDKEIEGEGDTPAPPLMGDFVMFSFLMRRLTVLNRNCPTSGNIILTAYLYISLQAGNSTVTMQPQFTNGHRRTLAKQRQRKGCLIIHTVRRTAYERFDRHDFTDDGHHAGAGGLQRGGRFTVLWEMP